MDLIDRLRQISTRIPSHQDDIKTEEATKNALVLPFIDALGYDVFDPTCVVPEFTADVGTKKGEKVDYAVLDANGHPILLFECKACSVELDRAHASQLYRYFSVTPAKFGVLTNGIRYRFYSDLEEPNKMDSRPFLEFSMNDVSEALARELKRFARGQFDLEEILSTAKDLKYTKGIKRVLAEEWNEPSEELVRVLSARVHSGRMTQAIREQFTQITKRALHEFLNDRVGERLQSALDRTDPGMDIDAAAPDPDDGIVTTDEEWRGFYVVKAILSDLVNASRITIRDRKQYCAVLLDDTNRKPICRLWFNGEEKQLGTYDAEKQQTKHPISTLDDIYGFADALRATVRRYEEATRSEQDEVPAPLPENASREPDEAETDGR